MREDPSSSQSEGTRSIQRVAALLKVLATRSGFGWSLTALADAAGLKKTTVHRMLGRIESEGLVHRRSSDQLYFLGPFIVEASLSMPGFHEFTSKCHAAMDALVDKLGGSTLLALRSGNELVLAVRIGEREGTGMLMDPGAKRPLLSTTPGIGILAGLPEQLQREIVLRNENSLRHRSTKEIEGLRRIFARARQLGYAVSYGDVVPGVNSVAVPLSLPDGTAFGSVTAAGVAGRFDDVRADKLAQLLRAAMEPCLKTPAAVTFISLYAG